MIKWIIILFFVCFILLGLFYAPKQTWVFTKELGKLTIDIFQLIAERMPNIIKAMTETTKEISNNINENKTKHLYRCLFM